jgi:patatin-like phospholipase/acyl hydrolase
VTIDTNWAAARGRFQVLSLDGGGIRGIFSAALLAGLEKDLGRPSLDHFDLVVGTSTGGLIAAALGAGMTPEEIVDLYVAKRETIFPRATTAPLGPAAGTTEVLSDQAACAPSRGVR